MDIRIGTYWEGTTPVDDDRWVTVMDIMLHDGNITLAVRLHDNGMMESDYVPMAELDYYLGALFSGEFRQVNARKALAL